MSPGRWMVLLTLGASPLLAAACGDGDTGIGGGATADTTAGDALGAEGEVTVRGTVDDVIADMAFTLTDATVEEGTLETDGEVAVVVTEADADVSESATVVVTGTLFSVEVSEDAQELQDLFGVNIDDEVLSLLEDQEVILASSVDEGG